MPLLGNLLNIRNILPSSNVLDRVVPNLMAPFMPRGRGRNEPSAFDAAQADTIVNYASGLFSNPFVSAFVNAGGTGFMVGRQTGSPQAGAVAGAVALATNLPKAFSDYSKIKEQEKAAKVKAQKEQREQLYYENVQSIGKGVTDLASAMDRHTKSAEKAHQEMQRGWSEGMQTMQKDWAEYRKHQDEQFERSQQMQNENLSSIARAIELNAQMTQDAVSNVGGLFNFYFTNKKTQRTPGIGIYDPSASYKNLRASRFQQTVPGFPQ